MGCSCYQWMSFVLIQRLKTRARGTGNVAAGGVGFLLAWVNVAPWSPNPRKVTHLSVTGWRQGGITFRTTKPASSVPPEQIFHAVRKTIIFGSRCALKFASRRDNESAKCSPIISMSSHPCRRQEPPQRTLSTRCTS